jgi:Tol biopolymer transport system component
MKRFVLCLSLLSLLLLGCGAATSPTATPNSAATGAQFILGRESDLWRFTPDSQQWTRLTEVAPIAAAAQPAVSPDGQNIAYAYRPPLPTPSADQPFIIPVTAIYLLPVAGGAGQALYAATEKYDSVDQPAWSPDGTTVYATYHTLRFTAEGVFTESSDDIVAIALADGTLRPLISKAMFPAPSPDGKRLAFVRTVTDVPPQLIVYDLASGAETVVLQDANLSAMEAPVWSADNKTLYVAASPIQLGGAAPWRWLVAGSAQAHGLGWRVWSVDVASKQGREINPQLFEDPRIVVDSTRLIVWTFSGMWQIDLGSGSQTPTLIVEPGDVGGISRLP